MGVVWSAFIRWRRCWSELGRLVDQAGLSSMLARSARLFSARQLQRHQSLVRCRPGGQNVGEIDSRIVASLFGPCEWSMGGSCVTAAT